MIAVFFAELIHLFSAILGVFCLAPAHSKVQVCLILIVCSWKANLQQKIFSWENFNEKLQSLWKACQVQLAFVLRWSYFQNFVCGVVAIFFDLVAWKSSNVKPFHAFNFCKLLWRGEKEGGAWCRLRKVQAPVIVSCPGSRIKLKYAKNFILSHHFYSLMQHKIPVFNGWSTSSKSQIHVARFSNQLLEMMNSV